MLVVQIEVAYDPDDIGGATTDLERLLDDARQQAAARIVGSYELPGKYADNTTAIKEWQAKALDYIEVTQPTRLYVSGA